MSEQTIRTGGPAFPRSCGETSLGGNFEQDGMTLRDWYAGQALAGEFAAQNDFCGQFMSRVEQSTLDERARLMFRMADAMIAAREEAAPSALLECLKEARRNLPASADIDLAYIDEVIAKAEGRG